MTPSTSTPPSADVVAPRTRAWRAGLLIAQDFPVADVSEHLDADPNVVVWVDLCEPDRDQLLVLADELSLHELAVEDALGPHQRPKLDHYDTHQFLSIHALRLDPDSGELDETEIDAFINARWIITIRKNDRFAIDPLVQRWDRSATLARHGVAFLLYGLLDHVVDQYFVAVDRFDEFYDTMSQALFDERPLDPTDQRHWPGSSATRPPARTASVTSVSAARAAGPIRRATSPWPWSVTVAPVPRSVTSA